MIFIVGPTGVGKSALALRLAVRFRGEIISADSRQVYRLMDIGTAKPTAEDRSLAPHHLIDLLNPGETFDLATFLALARAATAEVYGRGHLPLVTGGTGQYVWALYEGWHVPRVPPHPEFREAKLREAEEKGAQALHRELQGADPARASRIDPRNVRRVIRALEVHRFSQEPPASPEEPERPGPAPLVIGLQLERDELYHRIDLRVDAMMSQGFLAEVEALAERGYVLGRGPLSSPGYRELGLHLSGQLTLEEAVQRTKYHTHRLARKQYAWFRAGDERISWLGASDKALEERAADLVQAQLSQGV